MQRALIPQNEWWLLPQFVRQRLPFIRFLLAILPLISGQIGSSKLCKAPRLYIQLTEIIICLLPIQQVHGNHFVFIYIITQTIMIIIVGQQVYLRQTVLALNTPSSAQKALLANEMKFYWHCLLAQIYKVRWSMAFSSDELYIKKMTHRILCSVTCATTMDALVSNWMRAVNCWNALARHYS